MELYYVEFGNQSPSNQNYVLVNNVKDIYRYITMLKFSNCNFKLVASLKETGPKQLIDFRHFSGETNNQPL